MSLRRSSPASPGTISLHGEGEVEVEVSEIQDKACT